jgi:murein DD-endopeptidase MepM/ murein hydrolase activator NlpD
MRMMMLVVRGKRLVAAVAAAGVVIAAIAAGSCSLRAGQSALSDAAYPVVTPTPEPEGAPSKDYIKWVDFQVSASAMKDALDYDIQSHGSDTPLHFVEMISYLGARYGGNFNRYKKSDLAKLVDQLRQGQTMEALTADMQYYAYYREAYGAVLDGFVGDYYIQCADESGAVRWEQRYGLKVFSPFAKGYYYGDFDDFGSSRSYGFARKHLGHDMMASVGTPIVAVESGVVEAVGWNQYGGWRIGIRSLDRKRYYYYAHLRKDHPYAPDLKEGQVVKAGDLIGYLGMTGYSTKENVNNINTPHLHFGMQLVFDESQKEALAEIWIDVYDIIQVLASSRSAVNRPEGSADFVRTYDFYEPSLSPYLPKPESLDAFLRQQGGG